MGDIEQSETKRSVLWTDLETIYSTDVTATYNSNYITVIPELYLPV